ncbi:hypothetical protein HDF23_000098 [Mucilaginibacter lappiensis]|uniref:Uncharacterized protein n=1 Tax=Mucilaginibacter lappiensis TaxID=354630 RepID=A0ABR6PCL9_9SPHI|nr:hypothetical protein [Mucilaginibacter lappiensis]
MKMFSKTDHIKPMSLRNTKPHPTLPGREGFKVVQKVSPSGGYLEGASLSNDSSFLIGQNFYMPQNFGIFVCITARCPFIKGYRAVLVKEIKATKSTF